MERMYMWSSFKIFIEDLRLSSNVAVTVTKNRKLLSKNIGQVWFKLALWFQRRFLKKFTDGRQVMAIAHTGELKIAVYVDLDRLNMLAV
jgi:intein-encoded DNA endonuclease-like protein